MAHRLTLDGTISEDECKELTKWLDSNSQLSSNEWPYSAVRSRIAAMISDGVFDSDEAEELFGLLREIAKSSGLVQQLAEYHRSLPLDTPQPEISFRSGTFCMVGRFVELSRKDFQKVIETRGGMVDRSLKRGTEYLVVGAIGTVNWQYSSDAAKILSAAAWRDGGHPISIVLESHFMDQLKLNPST